MTKNRRRGAIVIHEDSEEARIDMVTRQIRARGVRDEAVLRAMETVPREQFMASELLPCAFDDAPQPILEGQTISQPYVVAFMLEALQVRPHHRVLEIGAGSGYAAAVLSRLVDRVYSMERHASLARLASWRLHHLEYHNVVVRTGDGSLGWPEHAPYDAILVSAAAPFVPRALRDQLAMGGRLVIPVGDIDARQDLWCLHRLRDGEWDERNLGEVRFVPLVGEAAWDEPEKPT